MEDERSPYELLDSKEGATIMKLARPDLDSMSDDEIAEFMFGAYGALDVDNFSRIQGVVKLIATWRKIVSTKGLYQFFSDRTHLQFRPVLDALKLIGADEVRNAFKRSAAPIVKRNRETEDILLGHFDERELPVLMPKYLRTISAMSNLHFDKYQKKLDDAMFSVYSPLGAYVRANADEFFLADLML
jgi:hypothetical protein